MKMELLRPDTPCFAEVERLQLVSKLRGVQLLLGRRDDFHIVFPYSTVGELTNLCCQAKVPMRWSFEVEWEGSLVAYIIPMHNKGEALASIDNTGKQIEVLSSTSVQELRRRHVGFRECVETELGIREALKSMSEDGRVSFERGV